MRCSHHSGYSNHGNNRLERNMDTVYDRARFRKYYIEPIIHPLIMSLLIFVPSSIGHATECNVEIRKDTSRTELIDVLKCLNNRLNMLEKEKHLVFPGAIIISSTKCPEGFKDITTDYANRYIFVDPVAINGVPTISDGSGEHRHPPVIHDHSITGSVTSGRQLTKHGNVNNYAIHVDSPLNVTGVTDKNSHIHDGGGHMHSYVGVRLCSLVQ